MNTDHMEGDRENTFDYLRRSQWLRAAVLGAMDGLVSTASLMMGVGSVKHDVKTMFLAGLAGLVAGACSMAIGEYVSVYFQYDIEVAQINRDRGGGEVARVFPITSDNGGEAQAQINRDIGGEVGRVFPITSDNGSEMQDRAVGGEVAHNNRENEGEVERERVPIANPFQAAAASAFAFSVGAVVPLLAAAFVKDYYTRLGSVVAALTSALVVFGWLGAYLGEAPVFTSLVRVLIGGWLAMAITFGLTKLIGSQTM